jgi:hypothetical protein
VIFWCHITLSTHPQFVEAAFAQVRGVRNAWRMTETLKCRSPYIYRGVPCDGSAVEYAAVLYAASGEETMRYEPLCRGHAVYEKEWSEAAGGIAKVVVEHLHPTTA